MDKIKNLKKFWKNKRVFITGHTGFKGSWLCIMLNLLGSKIYGYSLKPKNKSLFKLGNLNKILISNSYNDISNLKILKKKIKIAKPNIIFHLAAQPLVLDSYKYPVETFKTNILGTVNLLEAVRGLKSIKAVVIITTDKVYKISKSGKSYKETDELFGKDPYSSSKVGAELIVNSYIESFFSKTNLSKRIATARAGNVIGGGDYSKNRLIPDIQLAIQKKKWLKIRSPNAIRPWQHVIEPLLGYLMLAKYLYYGKQTDRNYGWNFGPNNSNFKRVTEILKISNIFSRLKFSINKSINHKETEILKLDSLKAKKKLKWKSRLNVYQTLKYFFEWNSQVIKGFSAKIVCEKQFLMYMRGNQKK